MSDWLGNHGWVVWIVAALILGGIEVTTLDLLFLMLAAGAAIGGVTAAFTSSVLLQVIAAGASAVAMLAVVRPVALRHLQVPLATRTGVAALIGRQGVVLERVDNQTGRVRLAGEVWSARSYDPHSVIEPGRTVDIVQIDGATAVVYESEL